MSNILEITEVSKKFGDFTALNSVSLSVPEGSIFGLLGPNGAGKTTLIRIINQILLPDSGTVLFQGKPLAKNHVEEIGYLPEERGLYRKMKVGEQALYLAQLKGLSEKDAKERLKYWFKRFDIAPWWDKKVEELSKGMQQKVQFITTVLHQPKLLIFDEPFSGFDPINVNLLKDEILNLRKAGATIIFSTHNMASVEELCDHFVLINRSNKILDGNVQTVKEAYKENIYIVEYEGKIGAIPDAENAPYHILKHVENEKRLLVKSDGEIATNQLLKELMKHMTITSFQEKLPSMNDIFIQKVQENK